MGRPLPTAGTRGQEALRSPLHDEDEGDAVEQEAVLGELAEQLRQADDDDGPEDDAGDAAHAADGDDGHDQDRHVEADRARDDRAVEGHEDGPTEAGEGRSQHVGQRLGLDQVDAQGLGHVLVLADGHPGATQARVAQSDGDEGDDEDADQGDVVDLVGSCQPVVGRDADAQRVERLGHVEDAARAADVVLEQVGLGQDADDLAEAEGGDGQVVAADVQDGQAQQDAEAHRHEHGEGDGREEAPVGDTQLARARQEGRGVGADGEEGHEAEVEQAGHAEGDVEAQAHQRIERDERDDRRDEAGETERQEQHHDEHDRPEGHRQPSVAAGLRGQGTPALVGPEDNPRDVGQDRPGWPPGTRPACAGHSRRRARAPRPRRPRAGAWASG